MSNTPILWSRGLRANLPRVGVDGTWYYTTDTNELFYGASLTKVNTGAVSSVAGRVGTVVLGEGDITNLTSDLAALTASVASEATARATADNTLQTNITTETTRAEATEALLAPIANTAHTGTFTSQQFNNVIIADQQPGSDWGAKVNAADAALGSSYGEIWISQAAGTSAPASDITLNTGHVLRFVQGGTWNLGSKRIIIPAGAVRVSIICENQAGAKIQYNGSDFVIVIGSSAGTLTNQITLRGLFIACQSTSDGAGCIHAMNTLFLRIQDCELAANLANKQYGILSDGTGNFSAYMRVEHCNINVCYYGIKCTGSSNSNQFVGGAITGFSNTGSWIGSIAIDIDNGNANNVEGCDIEAYDVGIRINNTANLMTCTRFEVVNTACIFTAPARANKVFCVDPSASVVVSNLGGVTNQFLFSDQALELQTNKNTVNGYAGLDGSSKLTASQLPTPSSTTLGGVKSLVAVASQWIRSIGTDGTPTQSQPAFGDISGAVVGSQLPVPSSSVLGGVKSFAAVAKKYLTSIGTDGAPVAAQPVQSDLSDLPISVANGGTGKSTAGAYGLMIARSAVNVLQSTQAEAVVFTATIPAGFMTANGVLEIAVATRNVAVTGSNTYRIRIGASGSGLTGTILASISSAVSNVSNSFRGTIANRGVLNSQISSIMIQQANGVSGSGINVTSAADFTNAVDIVVTMQQTNADVNGADFQSAAVIAFP
jgi:hypothetical protein